MSAKKLYVTLDSILDIRAGVLNTISVDFALEVTKDHGYFIRKEDIFTSKTYGTLKKENYERVLKEMRREVLENSFRTKMYTFIKQLRATYSQIAIQNSTPMFTEVDINIYPFNITDDESKIIIDSIFRALDKTLKVNLVNISPEELKLDIARQNYSNMILYHYHDWLNMYEKEIRKNPLRETNLYVPQIFFDLKETDKEQIENVINKGQDPFEYVQKILTAVINIEYLPLQLYCVDTPNNKFTA